MEFWDLTPREVQQVLKVFDEKQKTKYEDFTWLAWHIAILERQKNIPPLKQLLTGGTKILKGEELEKRRQEFKEMSEAWHKRPH